MKNFFLKVEDSPVHGGKRVVAMTHLPRVFTFDEARDLAVQLAVLSGPPPAPVAGSTSSLAPSPVLPSGHGEGI
jgi:hypothetical protein